MASTGFMRLVGCSLPVQQAGMGSIASPELAAAVSEAGGLGMLGTARVGMNAGVLTTLLRRVKALTTRPFGVNFIVSPSHIDGRQVRPVLDLDCVAIAAQAAQVVEFFYGDPDPRLVEIAHAGGALASWQVGSVEEAVQAERAGCDIVVVQGIEAGGHVRGTTALNTLLAESLGAVRVPVLAAGGIGTASDVAAALKAGADGVRLGTRFVAALEAEAHPAYVAALIDAGAEDTVWTMAFHVGFPDAPHRVLQRCIAAAEAFDGDVVGESLRMDGTRGPIRRFATSTVGAGTTGTIEAMPLWAGKSVGAVTHVQPAAEILREVTTAM
jgi:NAD(P)H-dependent flavin oxidoreductase YrpB (nitropropane dioxygenase family)